MFVRLSVLRDAVGTCGFRLLHTARSFTEGKSKQCKASELESRIWMLFNDVLNKLGVIDQH